MDRRAPGAARRPLAAAATPGRWCEPVSVRDVDLDDLVHRADLDGLVRLIDARCSRATGRACCASATGPARRCSPDASCGPLQRSPSTGWLSGRRRSGRRTCSTRRAAGSRSVRSPRSSPNTTTSHRCCLISPPGRGSASSPTSVRCAASIVDPDRVDRRARPPVRRCSRGSPSMRWRPTPTTASTPRHPNCRQPTASSACRDRHRPRSTRPGRPGGRRRAPAARTVDRVVERSSRRRAVSKAAPPTPWPRSASLAARLAVLTPAEALAWLAWAGASGGAHGRRRGNAIGRFGAWWVLAALATRPTTGRSTPTSSASSRPTSPGTGGTPASRDSAGSCSSPSRTRSTASPGRSAPATLTDTGDVTDPEPLGNADERGGLAAAPRLRDAGRLSRELAAPRSAWAAPCARRPRCRDRRCRRSGLPCPC